MRKRRILGLALLFAFLLGVLSGCVSKTDQKAIDESKIAVVAIGDKLNYDWDPAISYGSDGVIFFNTYETLLRSNPDGTYEKVLAEDYSMSEDGLTWTFKIRDGVKFHDGTKCDANAVKFAIERTIAMQQGGSYIWSQVKEINAIDDLTVQFVLNKPVDMEEIVSCQYAAFIYAPSIGDDINASSKWFYEGKECGTGPYCLESVVQDSYIILSKFDGYWGGWDGQHLEKVVIKIASEATTRRQMIEGGEADIAFNIISSDAEAMAKDENVAINVTSSAKNLQLYFNTEVAPLDNQIVRQAIAYSFPYEDAVNYIKYGKYASLPKDVAAPAVLRGSTESIPYCFDLDKAAVLLQEAGCADGFSLTVTYHNADEETKKVLELWKSELSKINVTLNIEANSWDVVYSRAKDEDPTKRQDLFAVETFADTNSVYSVYSTSCVTDGVWNFSGYGDPEIDKEIEEAYYQTVFDKQKSTEMLQAVGKKIADACFVLNLFDINNITATSKGLEGFYMNPAYESVVFYYNCYKTGTK